MQHRPLDTALERPCVVADAPCVVDHLECAAHSERPYEATVTMRGVDGTMRVLHLEGAAARMVAEQAYAAGREWMSGVWRVLVVQDGEPDQTTRAALLGQLRMSTAQLRDWHRLVERGLRSGSSTSKRRERGRTEAEHGAVLLRDARSLWLRCVLADVDPTLQHLAAHRRAMARAASLLEQAEAAARLLALGDAP